MIDSSITAKDNNIICSQTMILKTPIIAQCVDVGQRVQQVRRRKRDNYDSASYRTDDSTVVSITSPNIQFTDGLLIIIELTIPAGYTTARPLGRDSNLGRERVQRQDKTSYDLSRR